MFLQALAGSAVPQATSTLVTGLPQAGKLVPRQPAGWGPAGEGGSDLQVSWHGSSSVHVGWTQFAIFHCTTRVSTVDARWWLAGAPCKVEAQQREEETCVLGTGNSGSTGRGSRFLTSC